jgi:K+-transporting ATPase ATPase C chain
MRYFRPALSLVVIMTLLFGIVYPLLITGVSKLLFPVKASGSLLHKGTTLIGSNLIGQHFSDPKYFWGRPSATSPQPYNGEASGGSNLGPLNPALLDQVDANIKALRAAQAPGSGDGPAIPVDLVAASASGLDPDISVAGAQYQVARVAQARNMTQAAVEALIARLQSSPLFGIIGEARVNVLQLNMALDGSRNE